MPKKKKTIGRRSVDLTDQPRFYRSDTIKTDSLFALILYEGVRVCVCVCVCVRARVRARVFPCVTVCICCLNFPFGISRFEIDAVAMNTRQVL